MPERLATLYFLYIKRPIFSLNNFHFTSDSHCFILSFCEPYNIYCIYRVYIDIDIHTHILYIHIWQCIVPDSHLHHWSVTRCFNFPWISSSAQTVNSRYSWFHWPLMELQSQSNPNSIQTRYNMSQCSRRERRMMANWRSQWLRLVRMCGEPFHHFQKAQAIKSISAPFHTPDHNTNYRITHCGSRRLKSQALLQIRSFFFPLSKTIACFTQEARRKTNIFIQWSGHQMIIVFVMSGLLSFHINLKTVYLPTQRAVVGHKPGWSP